MKWVGMLGNRNWNRNTTWQGRDAYPKCNVKIILSHGNMQEISSGVGLLKYNLGRDVSLRIESRAIFIPNFAKK